MNEHPKRFLADFIPHSKITAFQIDFPGVCLKLRADGIDFSNFCCVSDAIFRNITLFVPIEVGIVACC